MEVEISYFVGLYLLLQLISAIFDATFTKTCTSICQQSGGTHSRQTVL